LERIYSGAGAYEDETGENSDSESLFARISQLSGGNFAEVYHSVRAVYSSLPNLADDLETIRQLALLKDDSEAIFKARRYITDATAPAVKFANLAMDRETLLATLPVGLNPCQIQEQDLHIADEPICPECLIDLDQSVPADELERLSPQGDLALGDKTQELSRLLVEKVIAGRTDERWLEFLQIVQASELSSLANTLDNDLVTFIKQVLD